MVGISRPISVVSDPDLILIVESEAKRFSVNEDWRDFDNLNDRKITKIAGAKLDQEPAATTKLIVDHFWWSFVLGNHAGQLCCITSPLYDCFILWLER
jgi:hypothetical protein